MAKGRLTAPLAQASLAWKGLQEQMDPVGRVQ
jgi:hypothetical protein